MCTAKPVGLAIFFRETGEPHVLYLGIDQHRRQLTISLRNGEGNVIRKRQVSTRPEKTRAFLNDIRGRADDGFIAVLEERIKQRYEKNKAAQILAKACGGSLTPLLDFAIAILGECRVVARLLRAF